MNLQKKLSTILIFYILIVHVVNGQVYLAIYNNISENSNNIFIFFHVLNKKQIVNFISTLFQYSTEFLMIGYLINWKFNNLFINIFSFNKIKEKWKSVLFLLVCLIITYLNFTILSKIPYALKKFVSIANPYYILYFLQIVILAPVFEEIIYRGIIYNSFRKKYGFIIALIVSSLIFGVAHYSSDKTLYANSIKIGIDILVGLLLAYTYEKSEQLCWPMAMHSIINFAIALRKFIP